MMDGMAEGSYIVVAKCGVLTTLGAQVITMLNAFYVCTNESGTYYICGSSVGDEVRSLQLDYALRPDNRGCGETGTAFK